jgi:putative aminopeptidase FrvX
MNMSEIKSILKDYMSTTRLSGYESRMAYKLKEDLARFADRVIIDKIGNVIGTFDGTEPKAPSLMVFAHMDVIGFVIRRIEPDGFIRIERVGGVPEKVIQGIGVLVGSETGEYHPGIIGTKAYHIQSAEDKAKVDPLSSLFVDIGAKSERQVNELGIYAGCPVTYAPNYLELLNSRIAGTYIDDAAGMTNLIQIASILKEKRPKCTVHLAGTVWEEFNARGAMIAARTVKTDMAVCLLGPGAGDTPDQNSVNNVVLGGGPAVTLFNFHGKGTLNGCIAHKGLYDLAKKAAAEKNIALQRSAARGALSDTAYIQLENEGIPCLDMGTPDRYSHSPMELCDLVDLEQVGILVAGMIDSVDENFDLNRY